MNQRIPVMAGGMMMIPKCKELNDPGTHIWVVVWNIFYFHPYLGKWSNLTNIFQMGWNHQLDIHIPLIRMIELEDRNRCCTCGGCQHRAVGYSSGHRERIQHSNLDWQVVLGFSKIRGPRCLQHWGSLKQKWGMSPVAPLWFLFAPFSGDFNILLETFSI